jgi:DNA repair protein RecN (Recombination protein N)
MLSKLYIKNLAIIQELEVEFDSAFNVFTGQTGAGKSLIIGAIELLLGFRPASKMVRPGATEALLVGVFDLSDPRLLKELTEVCDVPLEEGELILQRRISPLGKTANSACGVPIPLATLKQIGQVLVDIHGQHENQSLLHPAAQLRLLDLFAGTEKLAEEFAEVHRQWRDAIQSREELTERAELRRQQIDLYEFQIREIDQAGIKPGEQEKLETEHRQLSNVEQLQDLAGALVQGLEEGDFPVLDMLRSMLGKTQQLADIDGRLKTLPEQFKSAILELDDISKTLANYVDELECDPQKLAEMDQRLALLTRLAKKYGHGDVDAVLTYRDETGQKLETLRTEQTNLDGIDALIEELARKRRQVGETLSERRRKSAVKLAKAVNTELAELAMPLARFEVGFEETSPDSPSPHGLDTAEYMIQTNPGQPVMPLRKIASAGELSRITLGIKSILACPGRSSVLVFDEVDSNVGGRLGEVIGTKLAKLAASQQVLCISHLPQIAAFAQRHFVVAKQSSKTETASSIRIVGGDERVREIAEMISGQKITDTTLKQAGEMLVDCQKIVKQLSPKTACERV